MGVHAAAMGGRVHGYVRPGGCSGRGPAGAFPTVTATERARRAPWPTPSRRRPAALVPPNPCNENPPKWNGTNPGPHRPAAAAFDTNARLRTTVHAVPRGRTRWSVDSPPRRWTRARRVRARPELIIPIVPGVIFLVLTLLSARQRPTLANLTRRVPRPAAPVISRHQRAGTDREADPGRRPRLTRRTSGGDPHGVAARPKAPAL